MRHWKGNRIHRRENRKGHKGALQKQNLQGRHTAMRRSNRNFNIPPPPGQIPGIWTFENWIVQIHAPSGQNGVQMPYPIVGFVCEMGPS